MADARIKVKTRHSPSSSGNENGSGSERESTKRTVLRRERVIVLPPGVETDKIIAAAHALGIKGQRGLDQTAWVVVGEFEGASDTKAIEAHAGKQGTPDAKVGVYKAPPSRSWRGGEVYEKPPAPKVERKRLEED